jgi:hypothetical protein
MSQLNPYEPPSVIEPPDEAQSSALQAPTGLIPLDSWGTLAQVALLLNVILAVVSIALSARLFAAYSGLLVADYMDEDWVERIERPIRTIFAVMWSFRFVTAAMVVTWMYKAYRNLPILGHSTLDNKPIWAIVCWFVPIMNLFAPYQVVREIWWRSDPEILTANPHRSTPLVVSWWTVWISNMVLALWTNHVNKYVETATDMVWATGSDLLHLTATTVAAVLLMAIIAAINRRQLNRYAALHSI